MELLNLEELYTMISILLLGVAFNLVIYVSWYRLLRNK